MTENTKDRSFQGTLWESTDKAGNSIIGRMQGNFEGPNGEALRINAVHTSDGEWDMEVLARKETKHNPPRIKYVPVMTGHATPYENTRSENPPVLTGFLDDSISGKRVNVSWFQAQHDTRGDYIHVVKSRLQRSNLNLRPE
jgi:hypothetical protein